MGSSKHTDTFSPRDCSEGSLDGLVLDVPGLDILNDAEGIRAARPFHRDIPEGWPGDPRWIWLDPTLYPNYQTAPYSSRFPEGHEYVVAAFRNSFSKTDLFCKVFFRVSADRKYRLYVNGRLAGRGPAEAGGDYSLNEPVSWWFYDVYDMTPFLTSGQNTVCAEVVSQTGVPADLSLGQCGFWLEAAAWADGTVESLLQTDTSWTASPLKAFTAVDAYDARLDECVEWAPATPVSTLANLIQSPLPPMLEQKIDWPGAPTTIGHGNPVVADFGKIMAGFACFALQAEAGVTFTIEYGETPELFHQRETYVTKDGAQLFRSFRLNSFRYLRLSADSNPVELLELSAVFSSYPVSRRGSFECSDRQLNRFWDIGRYTTQICMQACHLDSPLHQEELGCTGDYMIEAAINYCCFGETTLAAADIERTARLLRQKNYEMFHTSYSLLWIVMLKDYYMYSGDRDLVATCYDAVDALLSRFKQWRGRNGLITECPSFMFMDWLELEGFPLHHPPCVIGQGYMSAFYHWALLEAAFLAEELGGTANAARFRGEAEDVRQAFLHVLRNPERGLFRDGIFGVREAPAGTRFLPADRDIETYTLHTNTAAVVAGVVTGRDAIAIMKTAMNDHRLIEPQPYFYHFVFLALAKTGLFDTYAYSLLRNWERLDTGSSTWREAWGWGDYSHAWGGTPTFQLTRHALGVTPAEPGCKVLNWTPHIGHLRFAEGTVPTPQGDAVFRWDRTADGLSANLCLPPGCEVLLTAAGKEYRVSNACECQREFLIEVNKGEK